jgi:hypothetical protein
MNTSYNNETLQDALASIEVKFREKIIDSFLELKKRAFKSKYTNEFDSAGIIAGKFCETVFRYLQKELTGTFIPFGTSIPNVVSELDKLEKLPKSSGIESLRVTIPRGLSFLYTLRNKRGIGHVGGDIEANSSDLHAIIKLADWTMIELIRVFHKMSVDDAQGLVDSINDKETPAVWEINGKKRVMQPGLDNRDKTLLLLYSDINNRAAVEDLFEWIEYSNFSVFKKTVIGGLHKDNLVEFDKDINFVHISPLGIREVEQRILKQLV